MRLTFGQLRRFLREGSDHLPSDPIGNLDVAVGMLTNALIDGRWHGKFVRIDRITVSHPDRSKDFDSVRSVFAAYHVPDARKFYDEHYPIELHAFGTIIDEFMTGDELKFYMTEAGGWETRPSWKHVNFTHPTVTQLIHLMDEDPNRRPDASLVRYFQKTRPGADVLDFAWFLYARSEGTAPPNMPANIRKLIDTASGYDQQALKVGSMSDGIEVQRALWALDKKVRKQFVDVNVDELADSVVSAALGWFGVS